ncbi:MAG: hypothetical protein H0W95_10200 [Nocardioidaceae bacterium]|nr:hypothetical protein [Nocardioidaceae bacterium]
MPGVAMRLLTTASIDAPGPFTATGLTTTTDHAGRWSFALTPPPPTAVFVIDVPSIQVASAAVSIIVSSKITLNANGRSLAGTVEPA